MKLGGQAKQKSPGVRFSEASVEALSDGITLDPLGFQDTELGQVGRQVSSRPGEGRLRVRSKFALQEGVPVLDLDFPIARLGQGGVSGLSLRQHHFGHRLPGQWGAAQIMHVQQLSLQGRLNFRIDHHS